MKNNLIWGMGLHRVVISFAPRKSGGGRYPHPPPYASLAQLVEPAAYIRVVGGSSPSVCTTSNDVYFNSQHQYGDKLCL